MLKIWQYWGKIDNYPPQCLTKIGTPGKRNCYLALGLYQYQRPTAYRLGAWLGFVFSLCSDDCFPPVAFLTDCFPTSSDDSSSLKFSPVFGQKKVSAHRFCAQTFCPSYEEGSMPMLQLFIMGVSRRFYTTGHGHCPPWVFTPFY